MFAAIKNGTDANQVRAEIKSAFKEYYEASGKATAPMSEKELEFVYGQSFMDMFTKPWMMSFYKFDPRSAFQKVHCPVLVVNEEQFGNVQATYYVPAIEAALRQAGNQDFTVQIVPPENPNMSPEGYRMSSQTFGPEALQRIADWISHRVFPAR
ncbi:MAG: hypothetical protein IPH16_20295 [Haliscomenobacter sp.]|nr:hypothetical protein [Haliscomenobacter sp.]